LFQVGNPIDAFGAASKKSDYMFGTSASGPNHVRKRFALLLRSAGS